jgi:hypothetical protein
MEIAKINLKLSGQTQNTVIKHNVTPAQLAVYAFMHGEDCVASLTVTGVDKGRTIFQEMQRLKTEFSSEHALKCLNTLFPGVAPALPVSFQSIGYDPEFLDNEQKPSPVNRPPVHNSAAANALAKKIRDAAEERAATTPTHTVPVHATDLSGALDDTGAYDGDDKLELDDDPLENEMQRMHGEGGLPPVPNA